MNEYRSMTRRHADARAFTIVELLVVLAIIALLLALLVLGIHNAREAARRLTCSNNIRQMAVAIHAHQSHLGIYPDGGEWYWRTRNLVGDTPAIAPLQDAGWPLQILPYAELLNVWSISDFGTVARTTIPLYACPTRRAPMVIPGQNRASMDYAANAGTDNGTSVYGGNPAVAPCSGCPGWGMPGSGRDAPVVRRPNGTPSRTGSMTLARISDGLSNTLLLGEKCLNVGLLGLNQTDDDAGWIEGWDWEHMRWAFLPPTADFRDTNPGSAHSGYTSLHQSFGSSHADMFMAAMCDGSVRPLSYSISLDTFQRLGCRSDRQAIDATSY